MTISQNNRRGASFLSVLATLTVLGAVGAYAYFTLMPQKKETGPVVITRAIEKKPFKYEVVERGEVESSSNVEVRCEVKAQKSSSITILEVVEEGKQVTEGEVLVRLDASGLEQDLVEQQIVRNAQEAKMITSRNNYEAAQIAKREYIEGTFYQEQQQIQSEIFIAEENLRRAEEYLTYSTRLSARGYVTPQQLEGDRFAVKKAETELRTGKTKLRVLQEYTKPKTIKQLDSDIKSAEADWKSDESSYNLEVSKLKDIEAQVDKCEIRAPQDGQVIHANETSRRGDNEFIVEPGANVREGQVIIRLPDPTKMQVKAKVNESRITDLQVGQTATIRIDAFGDRELRGEVIHVNEYPEPTSWYSSQVKEYAILIQITDVPDDLRPGLTAEATVLVTYVADAIQAPVQAVLEHGRKSYCVVKTGEDEFQAKEIEITGNNRKFVMIESGVSEGDLVAMNPRDLVSRVNLPKIEEPIDEGSGRRPPSSKGRGGPGGAGKGRPGGSSGGKPAGVGQGGGKKPGSGRPASAGRK